MTVALVIDKSGTLFEVVHIDIFIPHSLDFFVSKEVLRLLFFDKESGPERSLKREGHCNFQNDNDKQKSSFQNFFLQCLTFCFFNAESGFFLKARSIQRTPFVRRT